MVLRKNKLMKRFLSLCFLGFLAVEQVLGDHYRYMQIKWERKTDTYDLTADYGLASDDDDWTYEKLEQRELRLVATNGITKLNTKLNPVNQTELGVDLSGRPYKFVRYEGGIDTDSASLTLEYQDCCRAESDNVNSTSSGKILVRSVISGDPRATFGPKTALPPIIQLSVVDGSYVDMKPIYVKTGTNQVRCEKAPINPDFNGIIDDNAYNLSADCKLRATDYLRTRLQTKPYVKFAAQVIMKDELGSETAVDFMIEGTNMEPPACDFEQDLIMTAGEEFSFQINTSHDIQEGIFPVGMSLFNNEVRFQTEEVGEYAASVVLMNRATNASIVCPFVISADTASPTKNPTSSPTKNPTAQASTTSIGWPSCDCEQVNIRSNCDNWLRIKVFDENQALVQEVGADMHWSIQYTIDSLNYAPGYSFEFTCQQEGNMNNFFGGNPAGLIAEIDFCGVVIVTAADMTVARDRDSLTPGRLEIIASESHGIDDETDLHFWTMENTHPAWKAKVNDLYDDTMKWVFAKSEPLKNQGVIDAKITARYGLSGLEANCLTDPTSSPTRNPTNSPTKSPTSTPTKNPTSSPTKNPTLSPTMNPTTSPTKNPTSSPTKSPTSTPTKNPTSSPTKSPTLSPTMNPTTSPTKNPTSSPTKVPTSSPTKNPTSSPTKNPTSSPTENPTSSPTKNPTSSPTKNPTSSPTEKPTSSPNKNPTSSPTENPTSSPVSLPPTTTPTSSPTANPTLSPGPRPNLSTNFNSPTGSPTSSPIVSINCADLQINVDMIWVIDESNSVGSKNYDRVKSTIKKSTDALRDSVRMGVVEFSSKAPGKRNSRNKVIPLLSDKQEFTRLVNNRIRFSRGLTHTKDAFEYLPNYFQENPKSSTKSKRVIILVTDGNPYPLSQGGMALLDEVQNQLETGLIDRIVFVPVGRHVNHNMFANIRNQNLLYDGSIVVLDDVDSFVALQEKTAEIAAISQTCNGVSAFEEAEIVDVPTRSPTVSTMCKTPRSHVGIMVDQFYQLQFSTDTRNRVARVLDDLLSMFPFTGDANGPTLETATLKKDGEPNNFVVSSTHDDATTSLHAKLDATSAESKPKNPLVDFAAAITAFNEKFGDVNPTLILISDSDVNVPGIRKRKSARDRAVKVVEQIREQNPQFKLVCIRSESKAASATFHSQACDVVFVASSSWSDPYHSIASELRDVVCSSSEGDLPRADHCVGYNSEKKSARKRLCNGAPKMTNQGVPSGSTGINYLIQMGAKNQCQYFRGKCRVNPDFSYLYNANDM